MVRLFAIALGAALFAGTIPVAAAPVDVDEAVFTIVNRLITADPELRWEQPASWTDRSACETIAGGPEPVEVCVDLDFREEDVARSLEWMDLPAKSRPYLSTCIPVDGRIAAALAVGISGNVWEMSPLVVRATYDAPSRSGSIAVASDPRAFLAGEMSTIFPRATLRNMEPIERYAVDGAKLEETDAMRSVSVNLRRTFMPALEKQFASAGWSHQNTQHEWREICD